jgi:hypothetical protein
MILEEPIIPFGDWLLPHLLVFLMVVPALGALGLFVGYLLAAVHHGPVAALALTVRTVATSLSELGDMSLRRVVAMARLAFKEAVRNKVLVAFAVFVVFLLFAGWFLDVRSDSPERLYLSFVLKWTNYLILILAMFLSAFSLPNDMKQRTIYTIVTKPVRAWEIVIGKTLGFVTVGSVLILLMWTVGYVFVVRGLRHTHAVDAASVSAADAPSSEQAGAMQGRTTEDSYHRHDFSVDAQGLGATDIRMGHWHEVTAVGEGAAREYQIGPPRGTLQARVPIFGNLRFLDSSGQPADKGISVGKEWGYRGYIEGGTHAAAIWRFEGVTQRRFPRRLPLEMTIRVFRTYKGEIERGIQGTIILSNPETGLESTPIGFTAHEFTPDTKPIPRELKSLAADGKVIDIDLYDDLVHNGTLDVKIQCIENQQYFGAAQADVYLRAADGWFWVNFAKGYLSIWFQMVLVTSLGVAFSTFLSGPVAMLATLGSFVTGYFSQFIVDVATGEAEGGGPIESTIRIFKQYNLVLELDEGVGRSVVQGFDSILLIVMQAAAYVLPNLGQFGTTNFIAYGFDVPSALIAQHFAITAAYCLVITCAGYFLLKTREIAA